MSDDTKTIGTLYYFGDPMCSWCWGFKPVLEQAEAEYPELKRVTVLGGLRSGEAEPMPPPLMAAIGEAWHQIEEATSQPFDHGFWKEQRPLATTLPACRAVAAARLTDPALEWPFMVGMFQAYYTRRMDPSTEATWVQVAQEVGLSPDKFTDLLRSNRSQLALEQDLHTTKLYGITGFPSVVLSLNGAAYLVSPGYQPIEGLRKAINQAYEMAGIEFDRPVNGVYS